MYSSLPPTDPRSATFLTLAAATTVYLLSKLLFSRKDSLPPGPNRLPLIGSALQVPREYPWLTFAQWRKAYGNIVYADVLGQPLIVISSARIAKDLLDQRSAIYSDRPAMDFSQTAVIRYHSIQETEAKKLVCGLIDNPRNFRGQLKLRVGTIIIRVTYGHYTTGEDDSFLTSPLTAMDNFSKSSAPGAWVVDFLPILQHMPKWMPGASFLRTASNWRQIESGTVLLPNMCSTVLEDVDRNPSTEQEDRLVWAASTVMGGGMDTVKHLNYIAILSFFLAMTLNPAIQAKARKEIDNLIRHDRLPTIKDMSSLPYVRSVMTEVLRWHPAVPLGIPHALSKDDIYEGMHLPRGSLMIMNVWYMLHDPDRFSNPEDFNPDRYQSLDSEMDKVSNLVFGFGRRVCPGRIFAEATFFAIASTVLSTCEILPVIDAEGKEIVLNISFSSGTIM
ncbi:putative monooxygenase [Mycena epipterygia]|nr:putative monooxygenase [Mycena epipterygia]